MEISLVAVGDPWLIYACDCNSVLGARTRPTAACLMRETSRCCLLLANADRDLNAQHGKMWRTASYEVEGGSGRVAMSKGGLDDSEFD